MPELSNEEIEHFINGDFSSLGLPAPSSIPTPEEVKPEARERAAEVLSRWRELRGILERHEGVIRKRWLKKTKAQRTNIVLGAWPSMYRSHRPDFQALRKEGPKLKTQGTIFRDAYVCPYMNVEDLVTKKSLLLLMNSRGRHSPSLFARADFEAVKIGRVSGAVSFAFLNLHTMLLDGEDVETYGKLVSWDEDEDAMSKCFSRLAYMPGEGLLILEIQQKIMRFLVECCYAILHDIDSTALIGNEVPILPEPPSITGGAEWPTLASIAAEAPYRLPSQLDFKRLQPLVSAKRTSAEDHIKALREDPSYFSDVLGDWGEHRQEKLIDTNGDRHPVLSTPLFWERVIGNVILDAYGSLIVWDIISKELAKLASLQEKYSDQIDPKVLLPKEYIKALLSFKYTLEQSQKGPVALLKTGIPASPPMRSLWTREPHIPGSTMIRVIGKPRPEDRTMWLFSSLWDDQQQFLLGLPSLMDEIEHVLETDPTEKSRISSWVAGVFSDLGLIARLQHELEIYQPWAATFDYESVTYTDEIEAEFPRRFATFAEIEKNFKAACRASSFAKLGSPTEGRFNYPSDKRRNKQNTETMRTAERNLDMFWADVDKHYQKAAGRSFDHTMKQYLSGLRELERTPEWVEPVPVSKGRSQNQVKDNLQEAFSSLSTGPASSPSRFVPPQEKAKPKTRGASHESSSVSGPSIAPSAKIDSQPTFKLKSRAFKVFKCLFYNPAQADLPGEVSWADFLFAMAATGFAPEKLFGSVWQFTPTGLDVERSIQFHEPHPVAKIPFRNARRIGRRLNRAFGWHGGMFVLE